MSQFDDRFCHFAVLLKKGTVSVYICGVKSQNLLELDVVMGIAKVFHGFSESGGLGVQFYSGELFVVCRWADVVSVGG